MVVENTNNQATTSYGENAYHEYTKQKTSKALQLSAVLGAGVSTIATTYFAHQIKMYLATNVSPKEAAAIELGISLISGVATELVGANVKPFDEDSTISDAVLFTFLAGSLNLAGLMLCAACIDSMLVVGLGAAATGAAVSSYQHLFSAEGMLESAKVNSVSGDVERGSQVNNLRGSFNRTDDKVNSVSEDVARGAHGHNLRGSFNLTEYNITEPLGALSTDDNEVIA